MTEIKDSTQKASFIIIATGKDSEGRDFWSYLAIPYTHYDAYQLASEIGDFDLEAYGTVLAHGFGIAPPDEVKKEMQKKYKLDENFEDNLEQLKELFS